MNKEGLLPGSVFEISECTHCALLSNMAYKEKGEILRGLTAMKVNLIADLDRKPDVQGFMALGQENRIFVVLRGTNSSTDWLYNLKCDKKDSGEHVGFYQYAISVFNEVVEKIKIYSIISRVPFVVFTGHSLGGAMASILSAKYSDLRSVYSLSYPKLPPACCITFGSPRAGDECWMEYFNGMVPDSYRLVFENDIVPHLPPAHMGFRHVNGKVRLDKNGTFNKVIYSPKERRWRRGWTMAKSFFSTLFSSIPFLGNKKAIKDHSMDKYISALVTAMLKNKIKIYP